MIKKLSFLFVSAGTVLSTINTSYAMLKEEQNSVSTADLSSTTQALGGLSFFEENPPITAQLLGDDEFARLCTAVNLAAIYNHSNPKEAILRTFLKSIVDQFAKKNTIDSETRSFYSIGTLVFRSQNELNRSVLSEEQRLFAGHFLAKYLEKEEVRNFVAEPDSPLTYTPLEARDFDEAEVKSWLTVDSMQQIKTPFLANKKTAFSSRLFFTDALLFEPNDVDAHYATLSRGIAANLGGKILESKASFEQAGLTDLQRMFAEFCISKYEEANTTSLCIG